MALIPAGTLWHQPKSEQWLCQPGTEEEGHRGHRFEAASGSGRAGSSLGAQSGAKLSTLLI